MKVYLLILGLANVCVACGKTVTSNETDGQTDIPPEISSKLVHVEAVSKDRVRVSGSEGAISPGGGRVSITNTNRGDDATVTDVDDDGSFSTELPGLPDDAYALVATNDGKSSSVQTVTETGGTINSDWQTLHLCDDADPIDSVSVESPYIDGDTLYLSVSHGGGCANHRYGLCYSDRWAERYPIQVGFKVLHDAGGDSCEALIREELSFDLSAFKAAYKEAYLTDSGAAMLGFDTCISEDATSGRCAALYQWTDASSGQDGCDPLIGENCESFAIPEAPESWVEYQTHCGFVFRAPDDVKAIEVQPIDSCVFRFENAHCTFTGGSGWYSSGIRDFSKVDEARDYRVGQATIDGLRTEIVTVTTEFDEGHAIFIAGAHFPDPFFDEPDGAEDVTAEIYISCDNSENRDAMLPVLGTIRFD